MKHWRIRILLGILGCLCLSTSMVDPAIAQSDADNPGLIERIKRLFGEGGQGSPSGRQRGGGTLDQCPHIEESLVALLPTRLSTSSGLGSLGQVNHPAISVVGQTIQSQPTLWFYVPYEQRQSYRPNLF